MVKYLAVLVAIALYGCNCSSYTKNIVADQETHKGIEGVMVVSAAKFDAKQKEEKTTYTNNEGWFEAGFTVSGVARCPVLKLTLVHSNYRTVRVNEPQIGDTIFMHRIN